MSNITFVTTFLNIYEIKYNDRDLEWRFKHFKKIAKTGVQIVLYCSTDCFIELENILNEYSNIKFIKYIDIKDTWTYKICESVENLEPLKLHVEKNTKEYIILQNTKIEFLKDAIEINPWNSTHFAWIDFSIFHIFENNEKYATELIKKISKTQFNDKILIIPGCWNRNQLNYESLISNIVWRFCGGFFIGDIESIMNFHKLYELHFKNFLEKSKKLVWEVNFWAYLELEHHLSISWYKADHNISIIEIPPSLSCIKLNIEKSFNYTQFNSLTKLPEIENFLPTSTCFLRFKGINLINVRYVNYWIYPNGGYLIKEPNGHIYTKNMSCLLNDGFEIIQSNEMMDDSIQLKNNGGNIYGIEDIRLYELNDEIYFLGSNKNFSQNGNIRIIHGKYNINKMTYDDCKMIVPPNKDSWCEKNWVPFVKNGRVFFIYSWWPFQIGIINEKNDGQQMFSQLDIILTSQHVTPIFSRVRGSTPFIETVDGFIGLVHFSEETVPRTYYHLLVLLDKDTFMPLKYSNHFYFNKMSIEFCIGFDIKDDNYHFWISNFDRDPELIITNKTNLQLCNYILY